MKYTPLLLLLLLATGMTTAVAGQKTDNQKETQEVYQLNYMEREPGVDDYEVVMLVSDRYIRIDNPGEDSGYIIYDDKLKTIFSVSHFDRSTLVIREFPFSEDASPAKSSVEYLELADAPPVSGNGIYNYRVYTGKDDAEQTCSEIQLVENILPEVRAMLKNYQQVVSGQQVKTADNTLSDVHGACFYIDQVYNAGKYYDKGMPIQEWHSNDRFKLLTSYKKVNVSRDSFKVPENYRQFSVDKDSKLLIE
ncbi:MAG TPA: hypothetical protein ENJ11_01875 [Gammaproteobacteria bacterium]|nr:hypothetical protein [Gammaproteobacteria bacterium]